MREGVVALIRRSARALVILRAPGVRLPGYWAPLSGKIEPGESQEHAVVREVGEEVGLEVEAIAKVWECKSDDGVFLLHWWAVAEVGGKLTPDAREVSEIRWVSAEEFLALEPTFAADRDFFGRVFPTLD